MSNSSEENSVYIIRNAVSNLKSSGSETPINNLKELIQGNSAGTNLKKWNSDNIQSIYKLIDIYRLFYQNFLRTDGENKSIKNYFNDSGSEDSNTRNGLKSKLENFIGPITTKSINFKFYNLVGTLGKGGSEGKSIDEVKNL